MHFVFSCFKIWLLINSKHTTSQSWFKIERNVICCRSMGPLMSMVTCSVTSVTTTASSVVMPRVFYVSINVETGCSIWGGIQHLLNLSGICCHLQPLWVFPCQGWQWTRSWGLNWEDSWSYNYCSWQILKNNFSRTLSWWMGQIWIWSLHELLTTNLTTLPEPFSLHVMR